MKEIEVKVLEIDRETVEKQLLALGAQFQFEDEFDAILFDDAAGSIAAAKNLLRLRKEGDETVLTFKKFISDDGAKIRKEIETTVGDFAEMRAMLGHLGYQEGKRLRKIRRQFSLGAGKILFDRYLDEYGFIPEFLEIEVKDEAGLEVLITQLGFERKACLSWNTHDLIRHYGPKGES